MGFGELVSTAITKYREKRSLAAAGPLGDFYRAGGNSVLLRDAPVGCDDTVMDLGAYQGDFTTEVCWRIGARSVMVEPVPQFCSALRERFGANGRVHLIEAAVGSSNGEIALAVNGNGTSAYGKGTDRIRVPQVDVAKLVTDTPGLRLIKLNIEGAEYDVLERMASEDILYQIRSVLIQFHKVAPDSEARREGIRQTLAKTHREAFCFPFVWERWDLCGRST